MNDPSTESAACFSDIARFGSAKVGFVEIPFSSPAHLQFAVAGIEAGTRGEEGFVIVVPGSTVLDSDPVLIPNPIASQVEELPAPGSESPQSQSPASQAPPAPGAAKSPTKKAKKKRKKAHRRHHRKGKHAKKGKGKHRRIVARPGAQLNATPANKIAITVELAGDLQEFNLITAGNELPGTVMKMPIRLHLEGVGLGPECYIGTLAEPVVLTAEKVLPESIMIIGSKDPNGFPIRLLGTAGSKLEDSTLPIPAVNGCGNNAATLNEYIGLPATSGSSRMVFADNLFEFVEAGYDGTAPEGGAELQAAFDAAR